MAKFQIANKTVGHDAPVFIIAEAGINHDGKLDQAFALIDAAAEAGADAVKFQMFQADRMYQKDPGLYKTAAGKDLSIFSLIQSMEMPAEWISPLLDYCREKQVIFLSTVCDEGSADLLQSTSPSAFKIASYEINHLPLLKYVARLNRPMIFSTAGAEISDVHEAWSTIRAEGNNQIAIMHCVAKYPAPPEYSNLSVIPMLAAAFPEAVIGFSDHSEHPTEAPCAAVRLGARLIEKHFTIDKNLPGADHSFALNPDELKEMVDGIRKTEAELKQGIKKPVSEKLLGSSYKTTTAIEGEIRNFAYRGIFTTAPIQKGEVFSEDNIAVLRPGQKPQGLHPRFFELLTGGVRAVRDIPADTGIAWDDILMKDSPFHE
ncbi:N-acetylneuraminate synthase family protein [Bacillus stercoris]|uniref:N-acetylneuraminate synthase family protein n=1 Tax=Bacillus stercoris TaxID=2054641 RepID=UPI002DB6CD5D|nr:N-acetylneuraminate synthase family protein [Bacillus stercoris]MEC2061743.1 N-acetylneuraminate synthase family protein [Bacillus stercoris]